MTFEEIVKHFGEGDDFGALSRAARALGIPVSTLSDWRNGVPMGRQYELQFRTGGVLKADDRKPQEARA